MPRTYLALAVGALLSTAQMAFPGSPGSEDPNLPRPGYCNQSLVKTELERSRCDTKNAIAGAYFWITPGERELIDQAVAECDRGGSCDEANQYIARLSKSILDIQSALDNHHRRGDVRWSTSLALQLGRDPTGYLRLVKQFQVREAENKESAGIIALPPKRPIRTLSSATRGLSGCLSDVGAAIAGTSLVARWTSKCQTRDQLFFILSVDLYDGHDTSITSFVDLGHDFRMASPFSDGPTSIGTMTYSCGGGHCTPVAEKPQEYTTVALDLSRRLTKDNIARIAAARLEFKVR